MRGWLINVGTLVGMCIARPLHAQYPERADTGAEAGPGEWRHRGGMDDGRRMEHPLPSASQLEGPPLPDFMADRFGLDSGEARAYRQVYDSFMVATQAERDSARAARQAIDAVFQSGERQTVLGAFPLLRRLGDDLAKQEGGFDDRLKTILTRDHLKAYRRWRSEQRRQEEQQRREEAPQRTGG